MGRRTCACSILSARIAATLLEFFFRIRALPQLSCSLACARTCCKTVIKMERQVPDLPTVLFDTLLRVHVPPTLY